MRYYRFKVSVILPSLNVIQYIEKCLESVLSQTISDIELICVDAGSTDGTREFLEKYVQLDSRIKIIDSSIKSYGHQVNLGMRKATGKYVAIVDTDDFIDIDMYEKLWRIAEQEELDFAKGGFYYYFEQGTNVRENPEKNRNLCNQSKKIISIDASKDNFGIWQNIGPIWAGIYNREFLLKNDIWLNETPGASFQDTSFHMMVALCAKKVAFVEECFYHYRTDRAEASVKSNSKITCVMDEYAYIGKYMETHQLHGEYQIAYVARNKIHTYFWNLDRLDANGQQEFMHAIAVEMKEYAVGGKYEHLLGEKEQYKYRMLTDKDAYESYLDEKIRNMQGIKDMVSCVKRLEKYVIVGAGMYFERLLFLKDVFETDYILDVCDNNKEKQGKIIEGYCVISVEEAVKKHPNEKWIAANKYYADDIEKQLMELGVEKEQIVKFSYIPEPQEMPIYL